MKHCWHSLPSIEISGAYFGHNCCGIPKVYFIPDPDHGKYALFKEVNREECKKRPGPAGLTE